MDFLPKKIAREILTEEQIRQEGQVRDHLRKQILLDTVNTVIRYSIIIVPLLVFIWAVTMSIHFLLVGDWKSFDDFGKAVGYVVVGYVLSYLQQNGLNVK